VYLSVLIILSSNLSFGMNIDRKRDTDVSSRFLDRLLTFLFSPTACLSRLLAIHPTGLLRPTIVSTNSSLSYSVSAPPSLAIYVPVSLRLHCRTSPSPQCRRYGVYGRVSTVNSNLLRRLRCNLTNALLLVAIKKPRFLNGRIWLERD
jgi:hypothetical protein